MVLQEGLVNECLLQEVRVLPVRLLQAEGLPAAQVLRLWETLHVYLVQQIIVVGL